MPLFNRVCQRLLVRIADALLLHDDLRAHARGWSVEPVHAGTGRRYRDPRWDRLSECLRCWGAGYLGIDACPACGGRGVIDSGRRTTTAVEPGPDPTPEPSAGDPGPIRVVAERVDLPPGEGR